MSKDQMMRLRKTFALTKGAVKDNTITMAASTTGNPDRIGDVIFPGAFKGARKGFVADGSLLVGHEWDDMPIGMIMDASEQGSVFAVTAQFHGTPAGQEARQVCIERLEAGKSVSVSIGFMPDYDKGVVWFENGDKLLEFAKNNGCDMSLFDTKAIKALGFCRGVTAVDEVFEVSLVTVGMNPKARLSDAKSFSANELSALSALTLVDHLETALSVGEGIAIRLADYKASRDRDDRQMSPDRVVQIKRLHHLFGELLAGAENPEVPAEVPAANDQENRIRDLSMKTIAHKAAQYATSN